MASNIHHLTNKNTGFFFVRVLFVECGELILRFGYGEDADERWKVQERVMMPPKR